MEKAIQMLKRFERTLKEENRFFIDEDIKLALERVVQDKTTVIKKNTSYFRGRILNGDRTTPYEHDELGIPNRTIKSTGRFNSIGINHLYLATDIDTVIAELRPDLESLICIGEFKTNKDVRIVNLSDKHAVSDYSEEINISILTLLLGGLFAKPIAKAEQSLDYLPMQYFAELCKLKEIEGIMYFSSLFKQNSRKCNLTLFSEEKVKCIKTHMIKVNSIKYKHEFL